MAPKRFQRTKRWLRSLVGRDVFQLPQCETPQVLLGQRGGQWSIGRADLGPNCVLFSFGIGRDISFERELLERFGGTVHAFDPTPLALEWLRTQALPAGFIVHEFGVAEYDGTAMFLPPRSSDGESFSAVRETGRGEAIEASVRRVTTLIHLLGGVQPTVIKMDIEGSEYTVIPDLLAAGIRPSQILVEFHHRWPEVGPRATRRIIRLLNDRGYLVAAVSPKGKEYTFVRGRA